MGLRISVIVPVFNRQELIGRALRSIERQTAAVHQVIVVDDGSTDATADVVRNQFPNFELLQQSIPSKLGFLHLHRHWGRVQKSFAMWNCWSNWNFGISN